MYDDEIDIDPMYDAEPAEPDFDDRTPPASWPRYERRVRHVEWQLRDRASRPPAAPSAAELARAARRAARRPVQPSPF